MALTLDNGGYFSDGGQRLIPVGANYWPGSCGVEMWRDFPADEIAHDLDVLAQLQLNTVRFFLRWQDFEPRPGEYDDATFEKLGRVLRMCADRGIRAHPSLFVGFMSGGVFWPQWKGPRNVFADPYMLERSVAFARRAAQAIAPLADHVLAIDQGNELCCLGESSAAPPAAIVRWCAAISSAVREVMPQAIIISGNEQNQVLSDTGWRLGAQEGCDLYSMHGYPVPAWHSIAFDGMTDPLCQSLLPFYTRIARAFGPVMVQEFGTIVTFGAAQQDAYLRAILPACWKAGGNGFLWWCLRDIAAPVHPYLKHGFEQTLGLVDDQGKVKPGLEYFVEFAREVASAPSPTPADGAVGIYMPRHFYPRDNERNPGNQPRRLSRWMVMANYLLGKAGRETRVVRGDAPLPDDLAALVIPAAMIDQDEAVLLEQWVRSGGRLIWHAPDPVNWGHAFIRLIGARPVDYRAPGAYEATAFGRTWRFAHYPRDMRVQVVADSATTLATDQRGLPVLLRNNVGRGVVVAALPLVDECMASVAADRQARDDWADWYAGILSAAGA